MRDEPACRPGVSSRAISADARDTYGHPSVLLSPLLLDSYSNLVLSLAVSQGERGGKALRSRAASAIVGGLRRLGYREALLQENYALPDWFEQKQERRLVAAAFGETPTSYDSACIGLIEADGLREHALVNGFRSLGAPIILELDDTEVREWAVSPVADRHIVIDRFSLSEVDSAIARRAQDWKPEELLRVKNLGTVRGGGQLSLFSGLIPELETRIQEQIDPLLRGALSNARQAYVESTGSEPNHEQLFKFVFWVLTAKVFRDRGLQHFLEVSADPDAVVAAVARHYRRDVPPLLNRHARLAAFADTWSALDFRNLSVEVLSQIWSTTLVDRETRKRLGIHRTPRAIVQYILDRIPFSSSGDDSLLVFEPCSGSAAFLIGAIHALRAKTFGESPQERHQYFVKHLAGAEYDAFAVEISTLALTLADFPNPNGWAIAQQDVFIPGAMTETLRRAGVVLCNPPFENFDTRDRKRYRPEFLPKPAELLRLVLKDLHPRGVLGFVLPFAAVDGRAYKGIREMLARRFASLQLVVLPDRAFKEADSEPVLLVATEPIPHDACRVAFRRVKDDAEAWRRFEQQHEVSLDYPANIGAKAASGGFGVPALPEVWSYLLDHPRLGGVADIHRGLEWHERSVFVRSTPAEGYRLGVPPKTRFDVFEVPSMKYLSVRPEDQRRNAWLHAWHERKAIFNKSTRSRGPWRIAAFPDRDGVTCYQTYNAAWSISDDYDEVLLAAVLNSPVANAFIATREGKTDNTIETLRLMPVPIFRREQRAALQSVVERYQGLIEEPALAGGRSDDPEWLLKEIDAIVMDAYGLPPLLERQVLDYFRGHRRPVSHDFGAYFPEKEESFFSLSEYLDSGFARATAGELLRMTDGS